MKKGTKQALIAVGVLAVAVCAAIGCWLGFGRTRGEAGEKQIQVTVSAGERQEVHDISTEAEFLGQALSENGIIEGEQGAYGLFITSADGIQADETLQQWWCITKAGEPVATGVDTTPIAQGDCFELTLTTGY